MQIETWLEYSEELRIASVERYYQFQNICPSCDGCGDHGYDEDGCMYVCYGCGGNGKYFQGSK